MRRDTRGQGKGGQKLPLRIPHVSGGISRALPPTANEQGVRPTLLPTSVPVALAVTARPLLLAEARLPSTPTTSLTWPIQSTPPQWAP